MFFSEIQFFVDKIFFSFAPPPSSKCSPIQIAFHYLHNLIFDLDLSISYGFHAREGCKNLVVFKTGELLYYVAAVAVFFRRIEERGEGRDTQRHYLGHTEDISW